MYIIQQKIRVRTYDNQQCNSKGTYRRQLQTYYVNNQHLSTLYEIFLCPSMTSVDEMQGKITANPYNSETLKNELSFYIQGLPQVTSISQPTLVASTVPSWVGEINQKFYTGLNFLEIRDLEINQIGYIYVCLEQIQQSINTNLLALNKTIPINSIAQNNLIANLNNPTFYQLINNKYYSNDENPIKIQKIYYNQLSTKINVKFTSLQPQQFYRYLILITNEFPSLDPPRSNYKIVLTSTWPLQSQNQISNNSYHNKPLLIINLIIIMAFILIY